MHSSLAILGASVQFNKPLWGRVLFPTELIGKWEGQLCFCCSSIMLSDVSLCFFGIVFASVRTCASFFLFPLLTCSMHAQKARAQ